MTAIRKAVVAGTFYPGDADQLREQVDSFLRAAGPPHARPKAMIVPHAGYIYSGPVAATAYAQLVPVRDQIRRVVLVGPAHRVGFVGLATSQVDAFQTPLGLVSLDRAARARLLQLPHVQPLEMAHGPEHCLEVQLPFLQRVLAQFELVPLLVGEASAGEVADAIETVWGGEETIVLVSSDLSHYHDYHTARRLDEQTKAAIERLEDIGSEQACGCRAICGLLAVARRLGLAVRTLDVRSSGDTAGPRNQVVGYGAFALEYSADG